MTAATAQECATLGPNVQVEVLQDLGHWLIDEAPEEMLDRVQGFVERATI